VTSFASDVYKSTAEKSPDERDSYDKLLKDRAAAAWKSEGSISGNYAPKTSLSQQGKAQSTYDTGEYNRRVAAAGQEKNLATAEDNRIGSVADRVRDALYNRQQLQSGFETQQSQADRKYGQGIAELNQDFRQKNRALDFTSYRNAADRSDAMSKAFKDETLEMQILDANRSNSLKMADLERYYALEENRYNNEVKDWQTLTEYQMKMELASLSKQAEGMSSVLSGIMEIGANVAVDYATNSRKTTV